MTQAAVKRGRGRPPVTNWERIGAGVFIGRPYALRDSEFREHYVVRLDKIRTGKGRRYVRVGPDYHEARARALEHAGIWAEVPTIGRVLAVYFAEHVRSKKPNTIRYVAKRMRKELAWWADSKVTSISEKGLTNFVEHWIAQGTSPSTIAGALRWLRGAMVKLWEGELTAFTWEPPQGSSGRNPSRRIRAAIRDLENRYGHLVQIRKPFTRDEMRTILGVAAKWYPDWLPFVRLAFSTGMRISEIRALRWEHVNLVEGYAEICKNFSQNELTTPKAGAKGFRVVQLPPGVVDMLRGMRDHRAWADVERPYVFEYQGAPLCESRVDGALRKIFLKAYTLGVRPSMSLHNARHTYATMAQAEGIGAAWLRQQLGMSERTLRHYTHALPAPLLAFAEAEVENGLQECNSDGNVPTDGQ